MKKDACTITPPYILVISLVVVACFSVLVSAQNRFEQLPGPATKSDWPAWLQNITTYRAEILKSINYDSHVYDNFETLFWTESSYIQPQMMAHDTYFIDRVNQKYTVDRYLDDLVARFGGIDSVLVWQSYPNLGIDDRNQFDLIRDMPGGIPALKAAIQEFNERGVAVLFPYNPWDQGTRDSGQPDSTSLNELWAEARIQGFNGDTMPEVSDAFWTNGVSLNNPLAIEPEGGGSDSTLNYTKMGWGYWAYETVPTIDRYKWLEKRHMTNICNRWAKDHTDDIQHAFFNGCGFESWESIWGVWNQLNLRDAEATRRIATIQRFFAKYLVSPQWEPHTPTLQDKIYASKWPSTSDKTVLYTIINRGATNSTGAQLTIPYDASFNYFDIYHGVLLKGDVSNGKITLSFDIEAGGYGAVFATANVDVQLKQLLLKMQEMTQRALASFSNAPIYLQQTQVPISATKIATTVPSGMVEIPANNAWQFEVNGLEIEGCTHFAVGYPAVDVQYKILNETLAKCEHKGVISIPKFYIDKYPVTNAQYKQFLDASKYVPKDPHNFLKDWVNGQFPTGWDNKPVTWVSLNDVRAYADWAGKRLPNEWEWQYAMQGNDHRTYPWGNDYNTKVVPTPNQGRKLTSPDDVDAHADGASPFGVMDGVGNVWQMTNEYYDEHTRALVLKGGSYYQPQGSIWYFPQAYAVTQHGKWLLMTDSYDRSGTVGFRCVVDAKQD